MVCEDIKASCLAKVAGTAPERVCYRVLNLIAFVAFLAAVVGVVLKAKDPITEVEVEALDVFPWPVLFFCYQDVPPHSTELQFEDMIGLKVKPKTLAEDGVDCAANSATVWSMDLAADASAVPTKTCIQMKDRTESDLVKDLEARFKLYSKSAEKPDGRHWKCSTYNENGELASSPDTYKEVQFEWVTTLTAEHQYAGEMFTWSGILDPKFKTVAEQSDTFTYFTIPLVNSYSHLTFTVDKHVEKDWTNIFSSTEIGERAKVVGEAAMEEKVKEYMKDDTVKLKFNPALNTKPISPVPQLDVERKSKVVFNPLNYVSRTVTKRYKTWDEIWTDVGGAWATAVLLVSAFYVQKEVKVSPDHPAKKQKTKQKKGQGTSGSLQSSGQGAQQEAEVMEEVQVFRLRGVTSREEAVKAAFAMSVDAFDAGAANNEAAAPSVSV